jgi:hypothetical protein
VGVAHVVALDVVDEDALALDEPLVLLPRHALPGPALGRRLDLDLLRSQRLRHVDTALTASMMFQ